MFLKTKRHPVIIDLPDLEGGVGFNEESLQLEVIEAHIQSKMQSPHNFLEMAIFDQAQTESLRSIERKTKIPIKSLSRYYHKAKNELRFISENNLYL